MADITDGVIGMGIFVIVLAIVAMIISKIAPNVVGTDDVSNATIATIFSSGWAGLGLAAIGVVVFGAVLILGIVMALRRQ
ncbi:hypothetical protein MSHOH_2150 [Methanosarcina horonobensis HB-1 = JCM 15518]|uniref:Uncharacterized protein n=1 Tax=Methanosarcina horonobensis HB-1 = JCM 15518 TaxID=1434110 RepID=A0A0E3SGE8_9EURY|nr:hypothetical protein [Methanosarcina horonobensis]AKB78633.1 hypothetical protein MSHOH_2150 [Methanosarcina horonobensis HB-1 = JCM 15518]